MPVLVTCLLGLLSTVASAQQARSQTNNALECGFRKLMYAKVMQNLANKGTPGSQLDVFESLELGTMCGQAPPEIQAHHLSTPTGAVLSDVDRARSVFVAASAKGVEEAAPAGDRVVSGDAFPTVHAALAALRRSGGVKNSIVLQDGVHFLTEPMTLGAADSGMTIRAAPGAEAWLSGGQPLGNALSWKKVKHPTGSRNVWATSLKGTGFVKVPGLFTLKSHQRYVRARFPNANPEHACWGYSCPNKNNISLNSDQVALWHRPAVGISPTPHTFDFSALPNAAGVAKNDSTQRPYNTWTDGSGGVCGDVWKGRSYWCSNVSSGGWAEVDFQAAAAGQLQLPVGMTINLTRYDRERHDLSRIQSWSNPEGAVVAAWHSQTWFLNFFTVAKAGSDTSAGTLAFSKGGSQGGRNWCRCDQCPYAANLWAGHQWCGADAEIGKKDERIIGGAWMVENVFEELDTGAEFFYNETTEMLYVMPNATTGVLGGDDVTPPELNDLVVPVLQQLLVTTGTQAAPLKDLTIDRVNFRDSAAVYEEQWEVPSGGDWALHRSGAVFLQGTENATVKGGKFKRLDGNAIMLNGYNRDATITQNEFVYVADNVIAGWGETDEWDGRNGNQPRNTLVSENFIHEIGFFEKQSSAFFQAKTALTTIKDNVMFNMPRAAINFNDGFGGGNLISGNLIWNSCRESGDHGPINTWDRQAFFTDVPEVPSFEPLQTLIRRNFIFANYGAAQGVDNDDGSSHYTIDQNVFFDADGFKMDYGGHNSKFTSNFVVTKPSRGSCIGLASFKAGHGDEFSNNTCVLVGSSSGDAAGKVGSISQCNPAENTMHDNTYLTLSGNGTLGGCGSTQIQGLFAKNGIEKGSKVKKMPTVDELVGYAKAWLD